MSCLQPILWPNGPGAEFLEAQLVLWFSAIDMELCGSVVRWQSAAARETFSLRREVKLAQIGTGKQSNGGTALAQHWKMLWWAATGLERESKKGEREKFSTRHGVNVAEFGTLK